MLASLRCQREFCGYSVATNTWLISKLTTDNGETNSRSKRIWFVHKFPQNSQFMTANYLDWFINHDSLVANLLFTVFDGMAYYGHFQWSLRSNEMTSCSPPPANQVYHKPENTDALEFDCDYDVPRDSEYQSIIFTTSASSDDVLRWTDSLSYGNCRSKAHSFAAPAQQPHLVCDAWRHQCDVFQSRQIRQYIL